MRSISLVLHCNHCNVKMVTKMSWSNRLGDRNEQQNFPQIWEVSSQLYLSLFVCFHLGWEGDRVGFVHYQQGRWKSAKVWFLWMGQTTVGYSGGLKGKQVAQVTAGWWNSLQASISTSEQGAHTNHLPSPVSEQGPYQGIVICHDLQQVPIQSCHWWDASRLEEKPG